MLFGVAAMLLGPFGTLRAGAAVADDRAVVRGARVVGQFAVLLLAGRLLLRFERLDVVLARLVALSVLKTAISLEKLAEHTNSRQSDSPRAPTWTSSTACTSGRCTCGRPAEESQKVSRCAAGWQQGQKATHVLERETGRFVQEKVNDDGACQDAPGKYVAVGVDIVSMRTLGSGKTVRERAGPARRTRMHS